MQKVLKHKKLIAFILVFTLSFGVITEFNKKETHSAFVIDDITLLILGLTVLATGVIATSDLQIKDMGSRVWDKLVDFGVDSIDKISKLDLTGNRHILMNDVVVDSAKYVAENLPIKKTEVIKTVDNSLTGSVGLKFNSISDFDYTKLDKQYYFKINSNSDGDIRTLKFNFEGYTKTWQYGQGVKGSIYFTSVYDSISNKYVTYLYFFDDELGRIINSKEIYSGTSPYNMTFTLTSDVVGHGYVETINYDNTNIKAGYNETVINERIPWNRGIDELGNATSIGTISTNSPVVDQVINKDITQEVPLVWDDVKTGFVEKEIVSDVVQDKTIDSDITLPEELNLWNWLKNLLKSILDAIKSILASTFGFLDNLINALKNLLIWLFSPTVTVTELFPTPSTNGLGYIPMLFDYSNLWNITPKPIEFGTNLNRQGVGTNISRNWNIEFKPFEISFIKNNMTMIRNLTSYSLLMFVIWNILHHFMPKRDMD